MHQMESQSCGRAGLFISPQHWVYGADERVESRETLLRMITINYARLTGEDKITGSIELGKLADFAILSDDILTVTATIETTPFIDVRGRM